MLQVRGDPMTEPYAVILSCPRCGNKRAVSSLVVRQLLTLEVPEKCQACGKESPLSEWLDRPLGTLKASS